MEAIGELIEVIADRAGLSNLREVGEWLQIRRDAAHDEQAELPDRDEGIADVVGSDVLDFGQMVIAAMKGTTGDGDPDTGARFGHGHSGFGKTGETLHTAAPDDSWQGGGSRAYADKNSRQQLRTETMAAADLEVHRVLFREAAQITLRRKFLDDQSNFLAYTSYATFPLQFIKTWGDAMKLKIELNALQVALGESAYQIHQLHSETNANANELQQAIGRYRSVHDGAERSFPATDFGPPPTAARGDRPARRKAVGPPIQSGGVAGPTVSAPTTGPAMIPGAVATGVAPTPMPSQGSPPAAVTPPFPAMTAVPMAAAAPFATLIGPLAGLLNAAAALTAAENAASAALDSQADGDGRLEGDDGDDESENASDAAAGSGTGGRAPVAGAADSPGGRPPTPVTIKLNPGISPGPSAGMSAQDKT